MWWWRRSVWRCGNRRLVGSCTLEDGPSCCWRDGLQGVVGRGSLGLVAECGWGWSNVVGSWNVCGAGRRQYRGRKILSVFGLCWSGHCRGGDKVDVLPAFMGLLVGCSSWECWPWCLKRLVAPRLGCGWDTRERGVVDNGIDVCLGVAAVSIWSWGGLL